MKSRSTGLLTSDVLTRYVPVVNKTILNVTGQLLRTFCKIWKETKGKYEISQWTIKDFYGQDCFRNSAASERYFQLHSVLTLSTSKVLHLLLTRFTNVWGSTVSSSNLKLFNTYFNPVNTKWLKQIHAVFSTPIALTVTNCNFQ